MYHAGGHWQTENAEHNLEAVGLAGRKWTQVAVLTVVVTASFDDPTYLPMVACFTMFLANDVCGFFNWRRMWRRQQGN